MDTLEYNGTTYVKASVLAKRFRYTPDYIGQMCRSGKVDARLVGRSWYVNEGALIAHKETRYKPLRVDEKTINNNSISSTSTATAPVLVHPRLTNKVVKQVTNQTVAPKNFVSRLQFVPASYETDESDLLPQPLRAEFETEVVQKIPVMPEDAKQLRVTVAEEATKKLDFTDVPEVLLSGSVSVVALDEDLPSDELSTLVTLDQLPVNDQKIAISDSITPPRATNTSHTPKKAVKVAKLAEQSRSVPVVATTTTARSSMKIVSVSIVLLGCLLFSVLTLTTHVLVVDQNGYRFAVDVSLANLASVNYFDALVIHKN